MAKGPEELVRAHVVVKGRVQGVGFRYTTVDEARRGGVKGYVRNLADGSLEVRVEGERAMVESLVRFLHRGPRGALVLDVDIKWEAYLGDLPPFTARHY